MNPSRHAVQLSYDFCRRRSRRAGSSFYLGFCLLPHDKRRAMHALYAWMRHTDDLADRPASTVEMTSREKRGQNCFSAKESLERRTAKNSSDPFVPREALAAWRTAVNRALSGDFTSANQQPEQQQSLGDMLLPALADTVARFHVPHEHLLAVIDGVEMDLVARRYETFDDLRPYCERVASAVGLACIHIWGFRGPEAVRHARSAGIALQLTNILRDIREDAQSDRVYLPLADLRLCGYSVDDLRAAVDDDRFHRLMALEIARAEAFYRDGMELMEWLERDGRRIFGFIMATYYELLQRIAHRPGQVLCQRIHLGWLKRLQLAARWALLPPRKLDVR
jgi:phytoene synthase